MTELISIIIANYKDKRYIRHCVSSILKNTTYPNYEIIIVNYGWKKRLKISDLTSHCRKRILILNIPANIGYSSANMIGLKYAKGSFIALLNNDTIVTKEWLRHLYAVIKSDAKIAAAQSRLMLMDLPNRIDSIGHIIDPLGFLRAKGYLKRVQKMQSAIMEACIIQPAACLVRRRVIDEIGLFCEEYFWGHEDTDFSLRALICGYKLIVALNSVVLHKRSATLSHMPEPFIVYYSRRNILMTILKNYQLRSLALILPVHLALVTAMAIWYLYHNKPDCTIAVFRAISWNIKNIRKILKRRYIVQKLRRVDDKTLFSYMDRINIHRILQNRKLGSLSTIHLKRVSVK